MRELNQYELENVSGGFAPVIIGGGKVAWAAAGLGSWAAARLGSWAARIFG